MRERGSSERAPVLGVLGCALLLFAACGSHEELCRPPFTDMLSDVNRGARVSRAQILTDFGRPSRVQVTSTGELWVYSEAVIGCEARVGIGHDGFATGGYAFHEP